MQRLTASDLTDLCNTDFRSLEVLIRVHSHASVTRAARDLEMNQSAVSYTIDKLRTVFNDPLFVREARRLVPTPRCDEVVEVAAQLLERFSQLTSKRTFDPQQSTETVRIACNYYERELIVPDLVRTIRAEAPLMAFEIVDATYLGHDKLLQKEADLLIGPFVHLGEAFFTRTLYADPYVCMMDPAHPKAQAQLDLETYLSLEHIYITYGGKWKSHYLETLERAGHTMRVAVRTPSPAGINALIAGSALVATVPERLSRHLGRGLHIAQGPFPDPVKIQMVWTARTHTSAMHRWVRDKLVNVTRRI